MTPWPDPADCCVRCANFSFCVSIVGDLGVGVTRRCAPSRARRRAERLRVFLASPMSSKRSLRSYLDWSRGISKMSVLTGPPKMPLGAGLVRAVRLDFCFLRLRCRQSGLVSLYLCLIDDMDLPLLKSGVAEHDDDNRGKRKAACGLGALRRSEASRRKSVIEVAANSGAGAALA